MRFRDGPSALFLDEDEGLVLNCPMERFLEGRFLAELVELRLRLPRVRFLDLER